VLTNSVLMIMYGKSVGGAELQFIELANFLAEKNQVRLLSLGGDGSIQSASLSKKVELKVYSYSGKLASIPALVLALLKNFRYSTSASAIVTTSFIGNVMGYLLGCCRGTRTVSLQTVSRCMRRPMIDRFVLRRFHSLVAGADDIKDYLVSHLGARGGIEVVHNWVDFSKRGLLPDSDAIKTKLKLKNKLVVGCIGRLHPQKGQVYLIEAFSQVVGELPNSVLLLVGDGAERIELEQRVDQLGLRDCVMFAGEVNGERYNEMFAAIDIYVQPSIFEGLPRTLLDAMYYGKAIIASDINGNSEAIISMKNGILVPSGNAPALSSAIKMLGNDAKCRMVLGDAAMQSVLENFEMMKHLTRIENIIFEPLDLT